MYINTTLCENLPTVTAAGVWYRLDCKASFSVQYRSGSYIKIRGKYSNALWIAGVKLFGYQSDVASTTLPRKAKQIHIGSDD